MEDFIGFWVENYVWTVFFSFMFYMVLYAGSDLDLDLRIRFKGKEINPTIMFFIPIVNLLLMVYEWLLIIEIFKSRRRKK